MFQPPIWSSALLLAACSAPADDPASSALQPTGEAAADTVSERSSEIDLPEDFAGSGWRVQDETGARYITYLDADGRFRDLRNGDPFTTGAWEVDAEERICFMPDGPDGADDEDAEATSDMPGRPAQPTLRQPTLRTCWRPQRMASDGAMALIGPSGRRIHAMPVEYLAPPTQDDPDAAPDDR